MGPTKKIHHTGPCMLHRAYELSAINFLSQAFILCQERSKGPTFHSFFPSFNGRAPRLHMRQCFSKKTPLFYNIEPAEKIQSLKTNDMWNVSNSRPMKVRHLYGMQKNTTFTRVTSAKVLF